MSELLLTAGAFILAVIVAFFSGRISGKGTKSKEELESLKEAKKTYEEIDRMDDDDQLAEFDRLYNSRR